MTTISNDVDAPARERTDLMAFSIKQARLNVGIMMEIMLRIKRSFNYILTPMETKPVV